MSGLGKEPDIDRRVSEFHGDKVTFRAETGRQDSASPMPADSQNRPLDEATGHNGIGIRNLS